MPARSYSPKDKAKVEKAVQLVQQRILAMIRNDRFCSAEQLNEKIKELLELLNHRQSKAFGCSRWELFNKVEKESLNPLPDNLYDLAIWKQQKINGGYHMTINKHHYSVPYQFAHKKIDIRITQNSIEAFYRDERIACHQRDDTPGIYSTVNAHRPEAHRQQAQWNHHRLQSWANSIGTSASELIMNLFDDKKRHLYQKERSALGILRLSHAYTEEAFEKACEQALSIGTSHYESILSLLKRQGSLANTASTVEIDASYESPNHKNVRGSNYYH